MTHADEEAVRDAQAFRTSNRPFVLAVTANFVLAALCLGLPYLRGQWHTKASLGAFSRFAACLYGGDARPTLGLGLPASADAQFASQFMRAGRDWPGRCRAALDATVPPDVTFLWPSVKQGGAEVRAVVPLVHSELDAVAHARSSVGSRRVPMRALAAVERLRAGLTLLARAASLDERVDEDAVAFTRAPALAEPARLPLYAGASAALSMRTDPDGLEAVALDGGGISWLRVANGRVERRRLSRSSLVRAVVRQDERMFVVWAMPPDRCAEKEDRCVQRAMGFAAFHGRDEKLPAPTWLAAHPAGRANRSVRAHGADQVDVLALRSKEHDLEVRRFVLTSAPPAPPAVEKAPTPATDEKAAKDEKPPPLAALARFALPVRPSDALLLPDAVVYADPSAGDSTAFTWAYADATGAPSTAPPMPISTVAGTRAWLEACDDGRTRWLVHGTEAALAVSRLDASAAPATATTTGPVAPPTPMPVALAIDIGTRPEDPAHDRVQLLCTANALTLLAQDLRGTLSVVRCDASHCDEPKRIASDVAGFAAADAGGALVVATTGAAHPEIAVHRIDAHGAPIGDAVIPSVCWDPLGGMCGQPALAATRGRFVLGARDGADLLSLESTDAGKTWIPMRGLQVAGAGDADAVMRQHRLRHQGVE